MIFRTISGGMSGETRFSGDFRGADGVAMLKCGCRMLCQRDEGAFAKTNDNNVRGSTALAAGGL